MLINNVGHATLVVESPGVRLIVDPWLTERLDRFWEHYPALVEDTIPDRVDVILLSHHHYDHCHLPSLERLNRDAIVVFPATDMTRAVTNPGAGSFVVPWLLKRLGFRYIKGVKPFDSLNFGSLTVTSLPSAVSFPETTFLISEGSSHLVVAGDSMLHPATVKWVRDNDLRPALAILPIHSISTDACFRDRNEKDNIQGRRETAEKTFRKYLDLFPGSAMIPGAFGWRITTTPPLSEPSCGWMNRRLFPSTVVDGYKIGVAAGADMHLSGAGDVLQINEGGLQGSGRFWDNVALFEEACAEFKLDSPEVPMPAFEPEKFGEPVSQAEHEEVVRFVEHELAASLSGTTYFMQSIETGRRTSLRLTGYDDVHWEVDFTSGTCEVERSDSVNGADSMWMAERMFLRLMRAELPYGHSWGSWVGNSRLVESLFTEPRYFMRYVENLLQSPEGISRYGF